MDNAATTHEDLEALINQLDTFDKVDIKTDIDTHTLSSDNNPYLLKLKISEFGDEKELDKFVKACERLIRSSPEYRIWTSYIRDSLGYYKCEVTGEQHAQTTVDIHHHPFSLYSIVKAVILKKVSGAVEFCSYDICEEVIKLHYEMRAPFCLLVSSLHEKFHNGFFLIPIELIRGDMQHLFDKYFAFLDDDDQQTITARLGINKNNCGWTQYRWVNVDGDN